MVVRPPAERLLILFRLTNSVCSLKSLIARQVFTCGRKGFQADNKLRLNVIKTSVVNWSLFFAVSIIIHNGRIRSISDINLIEFFQHCIYVVFYILDDFIFDVASELFFKDDSTERNRIDISMSRISVIFGYIGSDDL